MIVKTLKQDWELLRGSANFSRLLTGQTFNYLYMEVWYLAMPFVLLTLSQSPFWMGAVAASWYLPLLLFGGAAGWLVDRMPSKSVLLGSTFGRALICLALALLGKLGLLTLPLLALACFGLGSLAVFQVTAKNTLLPALVPPERNLEANSLDESAFGVGEMAGLLIGGVLVAVIGPYNTVLVQALLLLSAFFAYSRIEVKREPKIAGQSRGFLDGVRFLLKKSENSRILLAALGVGAWIQFLAMIFFSIQVFYYKTGLFVEPHFVGFMMFWLSLMGFLTSKISPRLTETLGVGKTALLISATVPVGLTLLAASDNPAVAVVGAGFLLSGAKGFRIVRTTLCHRLSPKHMLGRINGAYMTFVEGVTPLAAFTAGVAVKAFGFWATFGAAAGLGLVGTALVVLTPIYRLNGAHAVRVQPVSARRARPVAHVKTA